MSPAGVIGVDGGLPWHYSGDLRRFKRLTLGHTIIMGRRTWESLPVRPLPGRRNVVITRTPIAGVDSYPSIDDALKTCSGDVWFVGGARIYAEALAHCDIIDVTHVPDRAEDPGAVYFPAIDPGVWAAGPRNRHPDAPGLEHQVYTRRGPQIDEPDDTDTR